MIIWWGNEYIFSGLNLSYCTSLQNYMNSTDRLNFYKLLLINGMKTSSKLIIRYLIFKNQKSLGISLFFVEQDLNCSKFYLLLFLLK